MNHLGGSPRGPGIFAKALGWVLVPVIVVFLGIMAGPITAMVAVVFPVIGVAGGVAGLFAPTPELKRIGSLRAALGAGLGFPLLFGAYLAPARAVAVFVAWPLRFSGGDGWAMVLDPSSNLILGAVGAVYWALNAVNGWRCRSQQLALMAELPTSNAATVKPGLRELHGTARAVSGDRSKPLVELIIDKECKTKAAPFYMDDRSGSILVDPAGASVVIEGVNALETGDLIFLNKRAGRTPEGFFASRLMPGDGVFVIGTVQTGKDGGPVIGSAPAGIPSLFSCVFNAGESLDGRASLLISDTPEADLTRSLSNRRRRSLRKALFLCAASALLAVLGGVILPRVL